MLNPNIGLCVFTLGLSIPYFKNINTNKTTVVEVHKSYDADVKDPKWALDKAELIIKGVIVKGRIKMSERLNSKARKSNMKKGLLVTVSIQAMQKRI